MKVEIEWNFNPPAAPHFVEIWERLVEIFKLSFYKVIGSRALTDEILSTISGGIEDSLNSMPPWRFKWQKFQLTSTIAYHWLQIDFS